MHGVLVRSKGIETSKCASHAPDRALSVLLGAYYIIVSEQNAILTTLIVDIQEMDVSLRFSTIIF